MRDDDRCGRSKEINTPELTGQTFWVRVTILRFLGKKPALFKSGQWYFQQDNTPVHNSILVTDYLTMMGIKTVSHLLYSPDLAPCDFWLFPKLRGCRYETRRWKRLWRRSLTRSHKRSSMGPSRSCLNGRTSTLQHEEITSKEITSKGVSCVYYP